jgi:phosphoglucosamine mutase
MTNKALENYFLKNKIKLIRTNVGDRNIIKEMKSKEFIIGGEPSGHIILNNYSSTGDGILASLEVLGIMKIKKKKLSVLSNIYKPYPQIIQNHPLKKGQKVEKIINKVDKKIKKFLNCKQTRLIIRKSGTENKIRIMSEAKDLETTKSTILEVLKFLKESS